MLKKTYSLTASFTFFSIHPSTSELFQVVEQLRKHSKLGMNRTTKAKLDVTQDPIKTVSRLLLILPGNTSKIQKQLKALLLMLFINELRVNKSFKVCFYLIHACQTLTTDVVLEDAGLLDTI